MPTRLPRIRHGFLAGDEASVTARAALRFAGFLAAELDLVPSWHRLHADYAEQLRRLREAHPPGPRSVVGDRGAGRPPVAPRRAAARPSGARGRGSGVPHLAGRMVDR